MDGKKAFIVEFPRHHFRRRENVARRFKQCLTASGAKRMQLMNHQGHRLVLLQLGRSELARTR